MKHMSKTNCEVVTVSGSTWAETLTERDAMIASIRAAGGKAKAAKNSAGKSGRCTYFMGRDLYPTNMVSGYVAWFRVEVAA